MVRTLAQTWWRYTRLQRGAEMNKVSGINAIGNTPDTFDVNNVHDLSTTSNEADARELQGTNANTLEQHQFPTELARLFMLLSPQDIEQFYQSYQRWILEQRIEIQQSQIAALQQKIDQNAALMEQVRPSAIALSTLAQLQASGVADIELLDQMLERGEAWLDRTMQQLAYCERMDLIGESYTEWCRHALEGAYDWIDSIQEAETTGTATATGEASEPAATAEVTENLLLQKLMSDDDTENQKLMSDDDTENQKLMSDDDTENQKLMSDDDTEKTLTPQPRITAPLPALDETSLEADDITASVADLPTTATIEPIADIASASDEAAEAAAASTAEPLATTASSVETGQDTMTEAEPVAATAFEDTATISLEIEQEPAAPVARTEPEALEVIDPAIGQTITDVEIDEPDQEALLDEMDKPDQEAPPDEIAVPETIEDDAAPAADDEIATASIIAIEVEEAEVSEPAEAEAVPQAEAIEAPADAAIEQPVDEAEPPVDEVIAESSPVAAEVATPAEDTAPIIDDTEYTLTAVEQEEKEQEVKAPDAPSEVEAVKDADATLSSVAEPAPQEEISPPPVEIHTPSDSVEAARSPQEQPRAPQPPQKPGFFKRLLAFLLS